MTLPSFWQGENFNDRFTTWLETERPPDPIRRIVANWIVTRFDNPYEGARRDLDIAANYWFARIPGTQLHGHVVVCGYWIHEMERIVRCDIFATLSLPLS